MLNSSHTSESINTWAMNAMRVYLWRIGMMPLNKIRKLNHLNFIYFEGFTSWIIDPKYEENDILFWREFKITESHQFPSWHNIQKKKRKEKNLVSRASNRKKNFRETFDSFQHQSRLYKNPQIRLSGLHIFILCHRRHTAHLILTQSIR